jgi:beta-galactosidase
VLNDLPAGLRPIVQVIDQPLRNNREAVLFEVSVGHGSLLVCTLDVDTDLEKRIVARQLRCSLLSYAASERFRPAVMVRPEVLDFILSPR